MNMIKDKLKELASLSIDKGLNLNINHFDAGISWSVFKRDDSGRLEYISNVSETAAEWNESSIKRIEMAIEKIRGI